MKKIYADFNNCDEDGRVRLNCVGSKSDIEIFKETLRSGMTVILYDDELQVEAKLLDDEN